MKWLLSDGEAPDDKWQKDTLRLHLTNVAGWSYGCIEQRWRVGFAKIGQQPHFFLDFHSHADADKRIKDMPVADLVDGMTKLEWLVRANITDQN